jgi:hypothetical protein
VKFIRSFRERENKRMGLSVPWRISAPDPPPPEPSDRCPRAVGSRRATTPEKLLHPLLPEAKNQPTKQNLSRPPRRRRRRRSAAPVAGPASHPAGGHGARLEVSSVPSRRPPPPPTAASMICCKHKLRPCSDAATVSRSGNRR